MSCCNGAGFNTETAMLPLNQRLVRYGKSMLGADAMKKYPGTAIWVFSFMTQLPDCAACNEKLGEFTDWFAKYGFFDNPGKHVKWILDDESDKNYICIEYGIAPPTHLFCRPNGDIFNMRRGVPDGRWLDEHVLPEIAGDGGWR